MRAFAGDFGIESLNPFQTARQGTAAPGGSTLPPGQDPNSLRAKVYDSGVSQLPTTYQAAPEPTGTLGSEAVRAQNTTGIFDPSWQQNLATFLGGLNVRPSGGLYINPSANDPFAGIGQAMTLGNAPIFGGPANLLEWAQGGNPFTWSPPKPKPPAPSGRETQGWREPNPVPGRYKFVY